MKVCSFRTPARAELVASRLEKEGLHPLPIKLSSDIIVGGGDPFFYIRVPEEEVERARSVLTDLGYEDDLSDAPATENDGNGD